MKATIPITLAAPAPESRHKILRSSLLAVCCLMPSMLTAQTAAVDRCGAVLIQQIDYATLDEQSAKAYLSVIDQNTWDSKKTDAGFIGKWTGFLGPMSGDFSYEKFDQARTSYFRRIKYEASAATSVMKLRKFISADQIDAWAKCVKDISGPGFSWSSELVGGRAFVSIRFAPISKSNAMPVLTEDVKVYNATDISVLPKKGQALDYLTLISGAPKDFEKQVTVEMYTDQGAVYALSPLPKPSPTPTSAPTTPPQKKQSFKVQGVRHKDKTVGKYFGFKATDLDAILGSEDWHDTLIDVSLKASGPFRRARVWRSSNGTASTAHGRYDEGCKEGDWHSGDIIYVQPESK